ncbi:MAG: nitrogenase [Oscillatoriales cyanobacterium SM2_2_1]|nr:nitrogenase [Oscillatoriales cyanobacterium SM2_2_1]
MVDTFKPYSPQQFQVWLRALKTIALADGDYSEHERELFHELFEELSRNPEFPVEQDLEAPITAEEVATAFGGDLPLIQNFLRTAVMMAMADGHYSQSEDGVIQSFCRALGQDIHPLAELRMKVQASAYDEQHPSLLSPVKDWLDHLDIHDDRMARFICRLIPSQCPFERDVMLFGRKVAHIPAMCKINPFYDQLVGLRFRSLSFLADHGEDISSYC